MNKQYYSKFDMYTVGLWCLILFHIVHNIWWIVLNKTPPSFDAAFHTVLSMRFLHAFQSVSLLTVGSFLPISNYYPPMVHLFGVVFAFISSYNSKFIQFTGTVFFAISLFFLFNLTQKLFSNKRISFFSIFFFSFFMIIVRESREHMLDIPLTALILGTLYMLYSSHYLTRKKQSYIFFVFCGISLMIKWTALIFLVFPLIYVLWKRACITHKKNNIYKLVFIGFLIIGIIILPWYGENIKRIIEIVRISATANSDNPSTLFSTDTLFFYLKLLINFQLSFVGFVFFIYSLYLILKSKTEGNNAMIWWVCIPLFLSYFAFTFFFGNKNIRYIIPAIPYFAIIMAWGAHRIIDRGAFASVLFLSFLVFYYILSFYILSFGIPFYPRYKQSVKLPLIGWIDVAYLHNYPVRLLYTTENWNPVNDEISRYLLKERGKSYTTVYYFINSEKPFFSASNVNMSLYQFYKGIPYRLQEIDTDFFSILQGKQKFENQADLETYINSVDIIVIPKENIGSDLAIRDFEVRKQIQNYFLDGKALRFNHIQTVPEPDADEALIFKRIK